MQVPVPPWMRSLKRGVLVTAMFCLLTMPVEYRGGGEQSHPHSGVQFLTEAAGGSLVHHHASSDHQHQGSEPSPDNAFLPVPGDQETPSLTAAAMAQKYAPMAIAGASGLYVHVDSARVLHVLPADEGRTGLNPAPIPPPPRFAVVT